MVPETEVRYKRSIFPCSGAHFSAEFQLSVEPQHLHPRLRQALDHFAGEYFYWRAIPDQGSDYGFAW